MIHKNSFIVILPFMVEEYKLKGSELLIFALIHGFSKDGESWYMGSTAYISNWVGLSEKNTLRALKSLCEKNMLIKHEKFVNNKAKRCYYKVNYNYNSDLQNSTVADLQNSTQYNIDKYNIDNIKTPGNEIPGLFEEIEQPKKLRGTTEPKSCLFENSRFANFEEFEKCFTNPDYEQIDIFHYYNVVKDWSASIGKKRKDWIAQARNIMRSDKEKGKLHFKPQYQPRSQKIDLSGALEYLNDDY